MNYSQFKLYSILAQIPFLHKSYNRKVMFIVFIGLQLPLLTLLFYIAVNSTLTFHDHYLLIMVMLLSTGFSTAITLLLLFLILYPINLVATTLYQYISEEKRTQLPVGYEDSAGQLMTYIQYMIDKIELFSKSLRNASNLDPLTGIQNRRSGEEHLRQDMARARRAENQILVALVDIDQLQNINDHFGYHVGDVCLTQIAEILSKNVREGDWLARWDGDEFLIVLWNFNHIQPRAALERIQRQTIKTPMGELLKISLSVGACEYRGDTDFATDTDMEALLIHLEEALSKVKQSGGGGIAICE
ncbi:response regulator [Thioploca ingrica]|uniref:diguanylate cyclase n=1 Tax=Thioploca ingrica TaxID=40754 RepID=A0A090AE53_9GAMM|nr:response regulator [Thioploca ingrica]